MKCPQNTESEGANSTKCDACGTGTKSEEGSAKCTKCNAGEAGIGLNGVCDKCQSGHYRTSSMESIACHACPIGFSQSDQGQASCVKCSPGEFNDMLGAEACKPCSNMTYFSGKGRNSSCIDCPSGWLSEDGSAKCIACGAGTFGDGCKHCPSGYARKGDDIDTTQCRPCKLGETTTMEGAATCSGCDLGSYGSAKGTCSACPSGQYQDGKGETSCKNCDMDTYLNEQGKSSKADCVACSKDKSTGTSTANTNEVSCQCKRQSNDARGFYTDAWSKCKPCPSGANCATRDGMLMSELFALPGYYRSNTSFIACTQGYTPPTPVSNTEERCCPLDASTNISVCNTTSIDMQCLKG